MTYRKETPEFDVLSALVYSFLMTCVFHLCSFKVKPGSFCVKLDENHEYFLFLVEEDQNFVLLLIINFSHALFFPSFVTCHPEVSWERPKRT